MKNSLLSLAFVFLCVFAQSQCTTLFYSEYVEGSSLSKAVEIYNPTALPVILTNYRIARYSNGSTTVTDYYDLTGTVQPYDVYVVTNGVDVPDGNGAFCDPVLYAMADENAQNTYPSPLHMNGDDAITLELISTGAILDIVGKVGEDPGSAWTDDASAGFTDANGGAWWTANHTLIRKNTVTSGVIANPSQFDATQQWDSLPENTWSNLGVHDCSCNLNSVNENEEAELFYIFPNPSSGENVLIKGTEVISTIEIYNSIGELVYTTTGTPGRADYNLSTEDLEAGIYFVHITFSNQLSSTQQLVKK